MFSPFWLALVRYARTRRIAYDEVVEQALRDGVAGASLRLTDIDQGVLAVWSETWQGRHRSGDGGWDWERIFKPLRRRPAAFHVAIWSGDRLCGLAAGRVSTRRAGGVRHTVSVHFIESAPDLDQPLRGRVALLAITAAEVYGRALGASRLWLIDPLPGALPLYRRLGFKVAPSRGRPVYCEREISR
jgi:hypothetical protein